MASGYVELRNLRQEIHEFRLRLALMAGFVLLLFFLLLLRFVWLQVVQHDHYHTLAEANRISIVPIVPNRGIITDRNGVVGRVQGEPPAGLYRRPSPLAKPVGAITSKFRSAPKQGQERIALLHALMDRVTEVVGAASAAQTQSQSAEGQTQSQGEAAKAPAADFAHAFIGAARALEIPARYVTGYVAEHGEDAFWHAWVEAWDDGLGWIGFDPMLGYCPTDKHVRVAVGLDAGSVPPVRSVPVIAAPVVDVSVAGQ